MDADIAPIAAVLADPARTAMLWAVSDGRPLTAGELARVARLKPSAATAHLTKLVAARLLQVERDGRHRWYRLANPAVVDALEALAAVGAARPRMPSGLSLARSCYDHLAGALSVRLTEALIDRGALALDGRNAVVTAHGSAILEELGVDCAGVADAAQSARRPLVRWCLDWSERRYHLAGALGAAVLARLLDAGWLARVAVGRALTVTPRGRRELRRRLQIEVDLVVRR